MRKARIISCFLNKEGEVGGGEKSNTEASGLEDWKDGDICKIQKNRCHCLEGQRNNEAIFLAPNYKLQHRLFKSLALLKGLKTQCTAS